MVVGMLLLIALDMGSSVLDKIIDEYRPGALLVIIRQIVVHGRRKIQQQVPRVLWHKERYSFFQLLGIRIRRIRMFLGLRDPDPDFYPSRIQNSNKREG